MLGKSKVNQVLMLSMRGLTKMVNKRNVVIDGVNLPNHIIARTNALQYAVKTW